MSKIIISMVIICSITCTVGYSQNIDFGKIEKAFLKEYPKLNLPDLQISYVSTLNAIKDRAAIRKQEQFFLSLKEKLARVNGATLAGNQRLNFQILDYETTLHLNRIELEMAWETISLDDSKSIITIPNGKRWYAHLLKRWTDIEVSPDEMYRFGLAEIEKVKSNMVRLQKLSGLSESEFKNHLNSEQFFFSNPEDVQSAFEAVKVKVALKADDFFPFISAISELKIARGTNASMSQAPAYYSNSTFYFNFFGKSFNKRQIGWFYAHEAIPGHHYQFMVNDLISRTEIQNLFWYPGFAEGWGAYVEHLGDILGVYETIYDEYGKWEWDLIRSVRVSLDVAINYYGWSDEKALTFWKAHIQGQDGIGVREINRMKRWPAQVISYKYGANKFLKLLESAKQNSDFDFKLFHKNLLKYGDIPLSIIN